LSLNVVVVFLPPVVWTPVGQLFQRADTWVHTFHDTYGDRFIPGNTGLQSRHDHRPGIARSMAWVKQLQG